MVDGPDEGKWRRLITPVRDDTPTDEWSTQAHREALVMMQVVVKSFAYVVPFYGLVDDGLIKVLSHKIHYSSA